MIPNQIIDLAVKTANLGPCQKSKRGVVIWNNAASFCGFNSPPSPFECGSFKNKDGNIIVQKIFIKKH